jgi:solute carrier family 25 carnitine/acylcarnitine transporter 20/29
MLVGHPLDTIKVLVQSGRATSVSWRALYRGISGPLVTSGLVLSLKMGVYENVRRVMTQGRDIAQAPLEMVVAAGAVGGLSVAWLTTPLTRVKVAQQTRGGSLFGTALKLWSEGTLYHGLPSQLLFEAFNGFYLGSYVGCKRLLAGALGLPPISDCDDSALPLWARAMSAAAANTVSWGLLFPADVIRTVQMSDAPGMAHLGFFGVGRALLAQGGVQRLYRGLGVTLLRAGPVSAVILPLFDLTLGVLEQADNKSGNVAIAQHLARSSTV